MLTIIFGKANNSKPTIKRLCAKSHRNDKDYYYHAGNFYDNVSEFWRRVDCPKFEGKEFAEIIRVYGNVEIIIYASELDYNYHPINFLRKYKMIDNDIIYLGDYY